MLAVGTALPNSVMRLLVLYLASRAERRLHQPCTISSLLRPARRCSRCQKRSSRCMQAFFSKNLSCLNNAPSVAFRVFPRCVSNGSPIVLHECNDYSWHMSPHIPPTGCWIPCHNRCRNDRRDLSNLGPDSVVALPKSEPLPDDIAREKNCWIVFWVQECDCRC